MKRILVGVFLIICSNLFSQSNTGMTGLIHAPNGRMLSDGMLILGASYLPEGYFSREGWDVKDGMPTYLTFGILPFVEVMFRYTNELDNRVNTETKYFPDRMLGFRLRLKKETKNIPSLVVGLHDLSSITGTTLNHTSDYTAFYFASSKLFEILNKKIDLSLAYSFDLNFLKFTDVAGVRSSLNSKEFKGITFGAEFFYNDFMSLIVEYDSKTLNSGAKFRIKDRLNLMIGNYDFNKLTWALNFIIIK